MMETKITVVDSIMGSGKTSKIINYINESNRDDKFIYITPYLTEVARVKENCKCKRFKDPLNKGKGKMDSFLKLVINGDNIITTHALFKGISLDDIELIKAQGYTLVMDEVFDVISETTLKKDDLTMLFNDNVLKVMDDGKVVWLKPEYDCRYNDIKNMALTDSLYMINNTMFVWAFPVPIFEAFEKTFVLTYLFDGQLQKYYYDLFNIKYDYVSVGKIDNEYEFVEYRYREDISNLHNLIHIEKDSRLNRVGDNEYALSKNFYRKNEKMCEILKKNTYTYFNNRCKSKSGDNMWTTFKDYKGKCSGKGFTKGFVSLGARATNEYVDKKSLAYLSNVYINPYIVKFFIDKGVDVDQDMYALSELLQWIWRSQIRRGDDINLYIPSSRMRKLLDDYLK